MLEEAARLDLELPGLTRTLSPEMNQHIERRPGVNEHQAAVADFTPVSVPVSF